MKAGLRHDAPHSAGMLLYRCRPEGAQLLLVHPGGPLWAGRDEGCWQIPKGLIRPGEPALSAALREAREELGVALVGAPEELCHIRQAGGKRVIVFLLAADFDASRVHGSRFDMEWPPRTGRHQDFPEVDRAVWFDLAAARKMILASQRPILEAFASRQASRGGRRRDMASGPDDGGAA